MSRVSDGRSTNVPFSIRGRFPLLELLDDSRRVLLERDSELLWVEDEDLDLPLVDSRRVLEDVLEEWLLSEEEDRQAVLRLWEIELEEWLSISLLGLALLENELDDEELIWLAEVG